MVIYRFPRTRAELPDKSIAIGSADRSKFEDLRSKDFAGFLQQDYRELRQLLGELSLSEVVDRARKRELVTERLLIVEGCH